MKQLLRAVLAVGLSLPVSLAWGQGSLPPESALPGQAVAPAELPSEATLPGQPADEQPQRAPHRSPDAASPSDAAPLPGEDQLPQFQVVQQVALPEEPPWLRLNLAGPTAPVQAVCFSRDGRRLMAGGNDKMLHSWIAAPRVANRPQRWIYETPVRWQVQRATRGDIHAIAPLAKKVAFAGIGASALTGEIVLADQARMAAERTLFDLERGHRSQILDLAATPNGLYSLDSEGVTQYWSADPATGLWTFRPAPAPPQALQDAQDTLRPWRLRGSRLACGDNGQLFYPVAVRLDRGVPYWRIATWNPSQDEAAQLLTAITHAFPGGIGALASDATGQRVAAADISDSGTLVLAELGPRPAAHTIATGANIRDVAISANGQRIAIVVAKSPTGPFELRLWNWLQGGRIQGPQVVALKSVAAACSFSPDGSQLAVTQQQAIEVFDAATPQAPPVRLTTNLITPGKVAFTLDRDYKLVIEPAHGDAGAIVFDTAERRYSAVVNRPATVPANPWRGTWSLAQSVMDQGTRLVYRVMKQDTVYCEIPSPILGSSRVTTAGWLAIGEDRQAPTHLLIGTAGRNHIYLLDITDPAKVRVVREFRGHSAAVRSVGVSADQRYVVSGSDDGSVNLWKLREAQPATPLQNAWGAEAEIVDGQVVLRRVIPDGPLYYRGARAGDVLQSVATRTDADPDLPMNAADRREVTIDDAEAIVEALQNTAGDVMLRFQIARNGAAQKPFYLHPAWQPLASLAATSDREWAFWTPYGYYDASFNGHKIFGWQINRGIDQAPDFFLAAELKQQLEKPRVMQRLLEAGSLPAAMQVAKAEVPFNLPNRLEALASLRPAIEIVSPTSEGELPSGETIVEAIIRIPAGAELLPPKARANGVPAVELLSESAEAPQRPGPQERKYRWRVALPPDERIRLEVVATTTDGVSASDWLTVAHRPAKRAAPPRLFVIAAGVSRYADQQIPQLDFAAANAQAFVAALEAGGENVEAVVLIDSQVTQPLWNVAADTLWQKLSPQPRPQDVVLFFLSGHGIRDIESQRYFFLTADSRFTDVAGRRYERCISASTLQKLFAGLPCRKIAILDTCHSGAMQPLKQEDLKAMLRAMEEDVVLTITASEGDEEAFESRERRLGRFTAALVDGLAGKADAPAFGGNSDGWVTLREAAAYVLAAVPQEAAKIGQKQHPTIFPKDLFPLVNVKITSQNRPPSQTAGNFVRD